MALQLLDMGIVAKDLEPGTNYIEVFLAGELSGHTGEITEDGEESVAKGTKTGASLVDSSAKAGVTVKAEWLPWNTTRANAPLVKKGMAVQLLKVGEADVYRWLYIGNQHEIMQHDDAVYIFGNTEEFKKLNDKDNTYYFNISSKHKLVKLHISNNDGEAVGWDITLDTKLGTLETKDTNGNYIKHDGKNGTLTAKFNSTITLDAPTINLKAKTINFDASTINQTAGTTNLQGGKVNVKSTSNFKAKATFNGNAKANGKWKPGPATVTMA